MITKLYLALKMTFYLGSENGMRQTGKGTSGGGGGGGGGGGEERLISNMDI